MKKSLLSLLLVFVLLLSMLACQREKAASTDEKNSGNQTEEKKFVPKDAGELWNKIDDVMDELDSYGTKQEMKSTYYYSGNKFIISSVMEGVRSDEEKDFYCYMSGESNFVCEELEVNETTNMKEAFYKGKMYVLNQGEGVDQRLCAPTTAEKYLEQEGDIALEDLKLDQCMNKDFSHQEDGTWKVSFSGYTKMTVDTFLEELSLDEDSLFGGSMGASVMDMDVSALADADFRAIEITIKLLFNLREDSTTAPEFFVKMSYDRYNEASFDLETFLPEEYTEVDDLLVLEQFGDSLDDLVDAKKGKFTATSKTNIDYKGQKETTEGVDEVTYGEENGSFYFDDQVSSDGEEYTLSFRGGALTVADDVASEVYPMSEDEAKSLVYELITSADFSSERVTSVEKTGEDTYLLKVAKVDETYWSAAMEEEDMQFVSGTQEITVTFKDGKLVQYSASFIIQGKVGDMLNSENLTITIEVALVVEEVEVQKGA